MEKLLKILHIENNFHPFIGTQVNNIMIEQRIRGHKIVLVTTNSLYPWLKNGFVKYAYSYKKYDSYYEKEYGISIKRVKAYFRYSGREIINFMTIHQIINSQKPDVIYVHGIETFIGLYMLMKIKHFTGIVIFDSHMVEYSSKNKLKKIYKYVFRRFFSSKLNKERIKVIAVCEETKEYLNKELGIDYCLIHLIPLGTNNRIFKFNNVYRSEIRKKLGININDLLIIYTGKISPDKKVHYVVDAILKLSKIYKDIYLLIVGSLNSEYGRWIETRIEKSDKIKQIGTQKYWELNKYYNAADVAVWPSASTLSIYDAQIVGIPVILENNKLNSERIKGNGLLYNQNSLEDLISKIEEIYKMSKPDRYKMGEVGRILVAKENTYEQIVNKIHKLIELDEHTY